MRKHLIWITLFLALAFVGDRLFGILFSNFTQNSQFRYSRIYNSNDSADILFVGNSRGLNFYQPEVERLTAEKTINLSYNGMPTDLAKTLVMDYLDHHVPPKLMVVDVTMCDRYNESLKTSMNLYTPFSERLSALIKNSASFKIKEGETEKGEITDAYSGRKVYYGGRVSQLYRYNSEIFQRVLYYRNKLDTDWIVDREISQAAINDTAFHSYQVRMFPVMVTHLKEMIEYAKQKGVEVKLVINPYFPQFAESIRDSFLTPLKSSVEQQTGLPVADFSTALQNVDEIGDYQHANKKGSIRYMNILAENGIFNLINANALTFYEVQPIQQTLALPATDTFPAYSNENTAPKGLKSTIPVMNPVLPKKAKKKRSESMDDFGFAVDTVGFGVQTK